jgi:hypothetical protein
VRSNKRRHWHGLRWLAPSHSTSPARLPALCACLSPTSTTNTTCRTTITGTPCSAQMPISMRTQHKIRLQLHPLLPLLLLTLLRRCQEGTLSRLPPDLRTVKVLVLASVTATHYQCYSGPSPSFIHGSTRTFLRTAPIFQYKWSSLPFAQPSPIHRVCNWAESTTVLTVPRRWIELLDNRQR